MTDHAPPAAPDIDVKHVRIAISSGVIGTAVEYYDFFIYGTAAALVLNRLFFPNFSPALGTLAAFATFAVGFLVRPLGSIVLGYVGDRIGRKKALVWSLLLMGIATVAIGCLPTFASIGYLAPVLLVLLRLVQGLALGGEWGGATVLASEYSAPGRRGRLTSLVQTGSPIGLVLASGAFALVELAPPGFMSTWGWRIPFWASALLVAVGLYIRTQIMESPEFRRAVAAGELVGGRAPALEVLRHSRRELLIALGLRMAPDIGFYVAATFLVSYATTRMGYSKGALLTCVVVAAFIECFTIPGFGALSDRFGRKPVYLAGIAVLVATAFPLFALISSRSVGLAMLGVTLVLALGHAATWGLGAAINSELFPTRYRTTGAALGLNAANIVAGGPAALIASALVIAASGASWLVSLYLLAAAGITLTAVLLMPETAHRDLSADPTRPTPTPSVATEGLRHRKETAL